MAIVWTEVTVCVLSVLLNEYANIFGWRQLEGLILLAGVGAKFWVIVEYSGVAGVVNGLSNAYFGLWGTFFSTCTCRVYRVIFLSSIIPTLTFALKIPSLDLEPGCTKTSYFEVWRFLPRGQ